MHHTGHGNELHGVGRDAVRPQRRGSQESDGDIPGGMGVDIPQRGVAHWPVRHRPLLFPRTAPAVVAGLRRGELGDVAREVTGAGVPARGGGEAQGVRGAVEVKTRGDEDGVLTSEHTAGLSPHVAV